MRFSIFLVTTAACIAALPAPLLAQGQDEDIVITASGIAQPREESGQAIAVIDTARLDTLQSATITDALRTLPGVAVAQRGPVGSQTSVFLRGGNSAQTLVLVDGVRINDPSSPNGAFDFGALQTGNFGRIELLRGANSVIWGSQAIGGVISLTSLAPTDALAVRALAEGGSWSTFRSSANLSGTSGALRGSVGGGYYRTSGISALTGGTERDGYDSYSANARLDIALGDNVGIDLRGFYNRGSVEYDSPFGAGANALPESRNRQFIGYVGAHATLFDGALVGRIAFTRTDIDRLGIDPVAFSFNNFDVSGSIDRYTYQGELRASDAITLVFGAEHEETRTSTSFEGAAPDLARNRVTGGYAQLIVRPLPGLTLTGGVRHDDYSDYGGQTTFAANAAFSPNGGATLLRASYAEGFRAPTLSEGQPPFGNPALRPETAENIDIGIEQRLLGDRALQRAAASHFPAPVRAASSGSPRAAAILQCRNLSLNSRPRPASALPPQASPYRARSARLPAAHARFPASSAAARCRLLPASPHPAAPVPDVLAKARRAPLLRYPLPRCGTYAPARAASHTAPLPHHPQSIWFA